jgi:hypothetical protein
VHTALGQVERKAIVEHAHSPDFRPETLESARDGREYESGRLYHGDA